MSLRKSLLVVAIVVLFVGVVPNVATASTETSTATSLQVTATPPKLPADGRSYAAVVVSLAEVNGKPTVSPVDTLVFLSSSESNVGTLPSSVTIPAGEFFALVSFTTTTTPGTTKITASSVGLSSPVPVSLSTETPSGFPTHIKVFATPTTLLARPSDTGTLTFELTDDQNLPAKAHSDVAIRLFSSRTDIATLDQDSVTLIGNQTFATGSFHTGFRPGQATITASSSGFLSGAVTISVVGPAPLKLVTSAQPSPLAVSSSGRLVVSLTDESGNPARAPAVVSVSITSSNLTVASVQANATIPAGQIYTVVDYHSTSNQGKATLTATSPGLQSSSSVITTLVPTAPVGLRIYIGPSPVLSDNQSYSAIVVSLVGATAPAVATNDVTVHLTSSSSIAGTVPSNIVIPAGTSFAVASFQSTYASGSAIITASSSNLLPDQQQLVTFGPVPVGISLSSTAFSSTLPASGGTYGVLSVSLVDASGSPAIAPTDIVVQLSSSKADVASVNTEVVIRQGTISALASIQTSLLQGGANVTASSVGLSSSALPVKTVIPAPSKLAAYVSTPVALDPRTGNRPILFVQLQDSTGNPARARESTNVMVTSSNSKIINSSIPLTIPVGDDYVSTVLNTKGLGTGILTASATGLDSSTVSLQMIAFPFSANISSSSSFGYIYANQTATITGTFAYLGAPLSKVNVTWIASGGTVRPITGITNTGGSVSTVFTPNGPGAANVTLVAQGPIFGNVQLTQPMLILQVPPKPQLTVLQLIRIYLYYIIAAIAAVIVAAVYVLRLRRKKARAELEAGFEAVS